MPVVEVNNAEATASQSNMSLEEEALIVRATMAYTSAHTLKERLIRLMEGVVVDETGDAAHRDFYQSKDTAGNAISRSEWSTRDAGLHGVGDTVAAPLQSDAGVRRHI